MLPEDLIVKKVLKATIKNFNGVTIQGAKGEKGDTGAAGPKGEKGKDGKNGKDGLNGRDGVDGLNGIDGANGTDGKDGSPDTPEQIADKLNTLEGKVDKKVIKGLSDLETRIETIANRPQFVSGGGITGVSKIVAGSGVTISPANGQGDVTINASGGGGSLTKGTAEVDFGAITTQSDIATVSVADATVTSTSYPSVTMYALTTTDHDPDDYMVEGLIPYVTNVQNGVGFDVSVRAPNMTYGKYKVTYQF